MKKNIIAIMSLTVMLGLASCSNDDYLGGHVDRSGAGVAIQTLTAQMGSTVTSGKTSWEKDDQIGVSVSYYDITAQNRLYLCGEDGKTFTPKTGEPIYIKGATSVVAYYPFVGNDSAEPVVNVKTEDQSDITDYLVAKADGLNPSNGSTVNLDFQRILSALQINITASDDNITKWVLSGINNNATLSTYTGELSIFDKKDYSGTGTSITSISLTLLPQTLKGEDGDVTLTLYGSERSYVFILNKKETFTLTSAETKTVSVNISDGMGTIDLHPTETVDWNEK